MTIVEKKLLEFKMLKPGWHFGEGIVIPTKNIEIAEEIYKNTVRIGIIDIDVFPGIGGEVRVTIYKTDENNEYYEFTIENNGEISFLKEVNYEEVCERDKMSIKDVIDLIEKI
jgi:hypothetical protein